MKGLFRRSRALALLLALDASPQRVAGGTAAPAPALSAAVQPAPPAAAAQPDAGLLAAALPAAAEKAATDKTPPSEGQGLLNLGTRLTDRTDYASAEVAFRQILDRPGFSEAEVQAALLGLARMYRKANEPTKAAAIYETFIRDYPTDERVPDALLELGRTLRTMGANKMALNRFYSVINSTLKLPQKGFEHYQRLARTAEYEIAETYFETGDYVQSSRYFGRLQLLDLTAGDRAHATFMAADSQLLSGDLDGGTKALHSFLETWPDDENAPEARFLLASSLRKLGHSQEALAAVLDLLRQAKRMDAARPQTWSFWQRRTGNLLANDFFQSGDTTSALAIYESMTDLGPEPEWQLPVLYQVALCHERLYDFQKAAEAYQKIVAAAEAAKPAPTSEIAELARMSEWRLSHIEWLQSTDAKLAPFFEVSVLPPHPRPKEPAATPAPGVPASGAPAPGATAPSAAAPSP